MAHCLGGDVLAVGKLADDNWETVSNIQPELGESWGLMSVAGYLADARACGLVDPNEASMVASEAEEQFGYGPFVCCIRSGQTFSIA